MFNALMHDNGLMYMSTECAGCKVRPNAKGFDCILMIIQFCVKFDHNQGLNTKLCSMQSSSPHHRLPDEPVMPARPSYRSPPRLPHFAPASPLFTKQPYLSLASVITITAKALYNPSLLTFRLLNALHRRYSETKFPRKLDVQVKLFLFS